jgi:hypothetical protein
MQTRAKRWMAISSAAIFVLLLVVVFSQRETPSETVHIGFAGRALVETNAVLFTITNQNEFPIRYELSVQAASGFTMRRHATKTGEVFPSNTFTFYVPIPAMNRWRVEGSYWGTSPPKLSPIRAKIVGFSLKMKLRRFSEWLGRPPARGSVVGPQMAGDRPN